MVTNHGFAQEGELQSALEICQGKIFRLRGEAHKKRQKKGGPMSHHNELEILGEEDESLSRRQ